MSREAAVAAYRHILRSARIAFQGDIPTLTAARSAARDGFEMNRALAIGTKEFSDSIQHAEDVAKILRENVVQGKAIEGQDEAYKLRIHEHTERGDNDSIKKGKTAGRKDTTATLGARCSS